MSNKIIFHQKIIMFLLFLILFEEIESNNNFNKYFFKMYPSKNSENPYILHAYTPFSEHLKIDFSKNKDEDMIKTESTNDYVISNITSISFYENDFMIKTCFGSNKIIEIIPKEAYESTSSTSNFIFYSEKDISNNFIYCYSTIIQNPDSSIKDAKAIITYWVEITSQKEYNHKCVLFYPNTKKFSQIYILSSASTFQISKKYPLYCTTFREKDIFCSYFDSSLNNQFVIETNKLKKQPCVYFVLSDFGQIKGNNMKPFALNKQIKSIFGGYYDVFLSEFHNNALYQKNSTVMLYSLYRKSLHASIVPMFANLELFFGTNIRDAYVEINLFNFILDSNEIILFFIYNNYLKVVRVDYSVQNNLFKRFDEIQNLGYYSEKLENCKIPKYMQSTYFTNLIKYNSIESSIVNKNKKANYIYQQDIAILLTCSNENTNSNGKEDVSYKPKLIEFPQCLNYLDSINGKNMHKVNFYLSMNQIIYDIYNDPKLFSFRNRGLLFYSYESHYNNLIKILIKLKSENEFFVPDYNYLYREVTHIIFVRLRPRYIPYFTKPFYLKYRLYNLEKSSLDTVNRMTSNVCFFQIKFFPWDRKTLPTDETISENSDTNTNTVTNSFTNTFSNINIEDTSYIESEEEEDFDDVCTISYCAICTKDTIEKKFICETCDKSELEVIVKDTNKKSDTYGQCICDTSLGFYKYPTENTCYCQEDYAYYKSTNLCWPEYKLKNGPYYIKAIDDITEIPIYDDCYSSCKKCSKGGDENNHNCEECKEGFAYIDDNKSNCYDKKELQPGYHEVDPDHYIKCHENCISCIDKPFIDLEKNIIRQYCTECRNNASFYIRENKEDEYFNCFEKKCDENVPSLMFLYSEKSNECVKGCDNGVQPYNNSKICLIECNSDYPFLEISTKKCYSNCEYNDKGNKISNIDKGICTNECDGKNSDGKCSSCEKGKYKNKAGVCVDIPKQCLLVDNNSGLCKLCNEGYYPLKQDINKEAFNCYETIEEIINDLNRTDFYLNETEKYWDECYHSCEACYAYGSENSQKCKSCKYGYHFEYYFENIYNNCRLNLTANENCTSTQADIYKYKDYCHLCQEGYSFAYGTDECKKTEELENGPFYKEEIIIKTGDNRTEEKKVDLYNPCYKYCKTCKEKGDFYDNKCTSCYDEYIFDKKTNNCLNESNKEDNSEEQIILDSTQTDKEINDKDKTDKEIIDKYDSDKDKTDKEIIDKEKTDKEISDKNETNINETDKQIYYNEETDNFNTKEEINDNDKNIWFKLGEDSFYFYKQNNCLIIFYNTKIFLVSNKLVCTNICKQWNKSHCQLKNYTRFENMTREKYDNLIDEAYDYEYLKNNVNIILNVPDKRLYFHLTNYVSESPKNLSYIDISEYQNKLKKYYGSNLLLMKVDIKRSDTQSTQVEYQFYNPNLITEKINLVKLLSQRRLDNEDNNTNIYNDDVTNLNNDFQIKIDLPVDWTEEQIEKINYLESQNIDAFNSSSEFYLDNCNQFTSAKGNDVFLKERKKIYYPDIPLCENNCTFVKYISETQRVTCQCNYKTNNDNYKEVYFVNNPVDKKFLKKNFLENFQTMKCIKVIFKFENLKSNAGFILTIIFIIIFVASFVLYYISLGFTQLKDIINQLSKIRTIKGVLKKSQNLFEDSVDKGKDKKDEKEENDEEEEKVDSEGGSDKGEDGKKEGKKGKDDRKKSKNGEDDEKKSKKGENDGKGSEKEEDDGKKSKNEDEKSKTSDSDSKKGKKGKKVDDDGKKSKKGESEGKKGDDDGKKSKKGESEGKKGDDDSKKSKKGEGDNKKGKKEKKEKKEKGEEEKIDGDDSYNNKEKMDMSDSFDPQKLNYSEDSKISYYNNGNERFKKEIGDTVITVKKKSKNNNKNNSKFSENNDQNKKNPNNNDENKKNDENKNPKSNINNKDDKNKNVNDTKLISENEDSKIDDNNEMIDNNSKKDIKIDIISEKDNTNIIDTESNKSKNDKNNNQGKLIDKSSKEDSKIEDKKSQNNKSMNNSIEFELNDNKLLNTMINNPGVKNENNQDDNQNNNKNNNEDNNKNKEDNNENKNLKNKEDNNKNPKKKENNNKNPKTKENDKENNENNLENDISNISNIKIDDMNNISFNTIRQSKNLEEDEKNISYLISDKSDVDPKELIRKKKDNSIKLKKVDSGVSDTSAIIQNKKDYDKDSDGISEFGKSIQLPEFAKKKKEYDKDSDINSVNSDLISNYSNFDIKSEKSRIPPSNPPKSTNRNPNKNKNNNQIIVNDELQSATSKALDESKKDEKEKKIYKEHKFGKFGKFLQKTFGNNSKIDDECLKKKFKIITFEEFRNDYNSFPLIYLDDLKKHHLLYFVFCACHDNNNLFLKLSYFSVSINLYFGLNTMLIFDSNMSDAYYDKDKAKPGYILMNLFLPFIICGLIAFIVKVLVMPSYTVEKMIIKIQNNNNLRQFYNGEKKNIEPELIKVEKKEGKKKHNIKNNKNINNIINSNNINLNEENNFIKEKDLLEKEFGLIYSFYLKKVISFYIISFIILGLNWYLMTSFCAIFKNTGVKLIVNSLISLLSSFILPLILGLIPAGLGYLSIKTKNVLIYRVYKMINIII